MAQNHFGSCGFFLWFLVCTRLSTHIYASEDPRMTWGIIFGCAPLFVCLFVCLFVLRWGLSSNLEIDIHVDISLVLRVRVFCFLCGFQRQNSGPHACMANTLLTEPSPQPFLSLVFVF